MSGEAYSYPTNVTRFSRALSQFGDRDGQKVPQIIYYQPGVGTGALADKLAGGKDFSFPVVLHVLAKRGRLNSAFHSKLFLRQTHLPAHVAASSP